MSAIDLPSYRTEPHPFNIAGNIPKYVGEADPKEPESAEYYSMGDYAGKTYIERKVENDLRDSKGRKYIVNLCNLSVE